jgi:hypothetical protein
MKVPRPNAPAHVVLRLLTAAALVLLAAAALLAGPVAGPAGAAHLGAAVSPTFDRGYKVDLLESLGQPPELVIFGGSRAQRFEPSAVKQLTGLTAFNFAVQNSRPEDVYAMSRLLFWRAPSVKLRCIWALQATSLSDSPLHPGLLADRRLAQFLPEYLLRAQAGIVTDTTGRELGSDNEFSARGRLLYNGYDARVDKGVPFLTTLSGYLSKIVPKAAGPSAYGQSRAKMYFERTLQLYNLHGVEPVLVIMPYHPTALAAFRAAGWDVKEDAFKAYLDGLHGAYRFHVVDYTDIAAFHGTADGFYDGAHITAENARRILVQAVKDAPEAFR